MKHRAAFFIGALMAVVVGLRSAEGAEPALARVIAWQAALDREGYSPGMIDGAAGAKTALATREFQRARGLAATGMLDEATAAALGIVEGRPAVVAYTIQQADQDRVVPTPREWMEKSKATYLGYSSLAEAVAERHQCSRGLLGRLNGGVNLEGLKVGDRVMVPAIEKPRSIAAAYLEVDLERKLIRVLGADGRVTGLFHCSIAAKAEKRPSGEARVVAVAEEPTYRFDPAMWPEVKNVKQTLIIPPGPRNPVGVCWIGLSLPGYGIHGTPNPELIGKTGSHGCIRLTNWDARRLGRAVRAGMAVRFKA